MIIVRVVFWNPPQSERDWWSLAESLENRLGCWRTRGVLKLHLSIRLTKLLPSLLQLGLFLAHYYHAAARLHTRADQPYLDWGRGHCAVARGWGNLYQGSALRGISLNCWLSSFRLACCLNNLALCCCTMQHRDPLDTAKCSVWGASFNKIIFLTCDTLLLTLQKQVLKIVAGKNFTPACK